LYDRLQALALLVFIGPTILTRQTLVRSQMYIESDQALRVRDLAVAEMARQSLAERADERRLVAADLHDEILQPLYKVTLTTHVLKTELAQGRLLDMEVDLPELVEAAEVASTNARSLIGELRESTLGRGGLAPSLAKLIQLMAASARVKVEAGIGRVEADGATELALYQIAKEALSNALTHARATRVAVELAQSEGVIALTIRDDGIGFDPRIEREGHFGLHIMRERASAAGAELFLDSGLGEGTQITTLVSRTDHGDKP
jgi:signal transduction histidine kinase